MDSAHPKVESLYVDDLRPHPRNYRTHPPDQLDHILASIKEHGFYRNIVIARDNTVLAGHGVVEACRRGGIAKVPCIRLPVDPESTQALKVLLSDNEIGRLAEVDDRLMTEILKQVKDEDGGLSGTGFDEMMLANLVLVTRPASEIKDLGEAAEWVGMPEFTFTPPAFKVVVNCETTEDRVAFMKAINATIINKKTEGVWTIWYPEREKRSLSSEVFTSGQVEGATE